MDSILQKIQIISQELTNSVMMDEEIKKIKNKNIKKLNELQKKYSNVLEKLKKILDIRFEKIQENLIKNVLVKIDSLNQEKKNKNDRFNEYLDRIKSLKLLESREKYLNDTIKRIEYIYNKNNRSVGGGENNSKKELYELILNNSDSVTEPTESGDDNIDYYSDDEYVDEEEERKYNEEDSGDKVINIDNYTNIGDFMNFINQD